MGKIKDRVMGWNQRNIVNSNRISKYTNDRIIRERRQPIYDLYFEIGEMTS